MWPSNRNIGGIGWWPVAPTRHDQRRKLHHKATTTCLQSRAPEMNLFRSQNLSRRTSSWRARTIGCRRPVPVLVFIAIHGYVVPNFTHYSAPDMQQYYFEVSNNTCTLCVDPLQARPTKCCGRRSRYSMAKQAPYICTPLVCHYAYNTYQVLLIPVTSLWASTTATAVRVYNSMYMALCTEHFTCSIFGTITTAAAVAIGVIVLTLTNRYNAVQG